MSIKNELQQPGRGKHITGHSMTAPERYAPDTRHMVIMNIIKDHAGHKAGGRVRQFLTDEGYNETIQADGRGDVTDRDAERGMREYAGCAGAAEEPVQRYGREYA